LFSLRRPSVSELPPAESEFPHTVETKNRAQGPVLQGKSAGLGRSDATQADAAQAPAGPAAQQTGVVRAFKQAWEAKDIDALIGLLDPHATATADGGGLVSAALRPIEGREQVARYALDVAGRAPNLTILERTVNGQPGLVAQQDGVTVTVFAFEVVGDKITHIWAVRNPDKLRPWTAG